MFLSSIQLFKIMTGVYSNKRNKIDAKNPRKKAMHEYYTPNSTEFQAILGNFAFFVNYADFYVNIIM